MSPSPDPEPSDPDKSLMKLREIFADAAERSTGPGKPKFERLSKSFNAFHDAAVAEDAPKFARARTEFQAAMADVQLFAKTDPDTAAILIEVSKAVTKSAEDESLPPPKKRRASKRWHI